MSKAYIVGFLSPTVDGSAYIMTRVTFTREAASELTRYFDGKNLPIEIMSDSGDTYGHAKRKLVNQLLMRADFDKALEPIVEMLHKHEELFDFEP